MTTPTLPYWLASLYLPGIGPRKIFAWLQQLGDIKKLFSSSRNELKAAGIPEKYIHSMMNPNWKSVDDDLAWALHSDHHLIDFDNEGYPALLKAISDPPLLLYLRGDQSILQQKQLAIVGSRHASPSGLATAESFAFALADAGLVITSGLAGGIDSAAHRGALNAKGKTIGVAGTGLKHTYPASNRALVDEMVATGSAVISEFPLNTPPKAANFPRRNRIICGLSRGVLVVEAALQSGSLITARHALEQDRDVFAIPGSIHHPLSRGCHHLIRQGAKLVEKIEDIFEEWHEFPRFLQKAPAPLAAVIDDLPEDYQQFLAQIEVSVTPIDVIILRTGLTAGEVSSMLLILELQGHIQAVTGGYRRLPLQN